MSSRRAHPSGVGSVPLWRVLPGARPSRSGAGLRAAAVGAGVPLSLARARCRCLSLFLSRSLCQSCTWASAQAPTRGHRALQCGLWAGAQWRCNIDPPRCPGDRWAIGARGSRGGAVTTAVRRPGTSGDVTYSFPRPRGDASTGVDFWGPRVLVPIGDSALSPAPAGMSPQGASVARDPHPRVRPREPLDRPDVHWPALCSWQGWEASGASLLLFPSHFLSSPGTGLVPRLGEEHLG